MRTLIKRLLISLGIDASKRFDQSCPTSAILRTLTRLAFNFTRGVFKRIRFGESAGLLLIGKGVIIRHSGQLKVGKYFTAEDNYEVTGVLGYMSYLETKRATKASC